MPLPKQIREQVEETNRLAEEVYGTSSAQEEDDKGGEEVEATTVDGGEEVEQGPGEEGGADDDGGEVVEAQPTAKGDEDNWEHKYKTLQGMFQSEKRRTTELTGRIEGLESMLAKLNALREAGSTPDNETTAAQDAAVKRLLSEEEISDYGSDLIDVMKRAALEAVQDELNALKSENKQLKEVVGGMGQRQEMSDRDKFYATLEAEVDNWKELNRDPGFLEWLNQLDMYTDETRQTLLRKAFERGDAKRVARFFQGYLNENAAVTQATSQATPQPKPVNGNGRGKVDLATLAAPGAGATGSADSTGQVSAKQWKESEIGAFYESARKGQFKGRDDDYRRIETQIQAALNEGRILVGQ